MRGNPNPNPIPNQGLERLVARGELTAHELETLRSTGNPNP